MVYTDYFFVVLVTVGLYLMIHMIYWTGGHSWRH
jgi:hypothetical protein